MTAGRCKNRPAFTLVEAVVSLLIVGILLVVSTTAFSGIAQSRRIQMERREAYLLGQSLMGEILQQYFQAPGTGAVFGPQPGQTRATFTGVDQYDGYTASPPADRAGGALPDYAGWTCSVSVSYAKPTNPSQPVATSSLKRVVVTVTAPSGKSYVLNGFRSPFGPYEIVPVSPVNYLPGVGVAVQGSFPAKTIFTAGRPLNITGSQ